MEKQNIPAWIYHLHVKYPAELLRSLFDIFCGEKTLISLAGDLSYCDTRGIHVVSQKPAEILSQNIASKQGEVVLLLNSASKAYFEKNILARAGIHSRIWHILISVSDQIVFASYDQFDAGCVWITAEVGEKWLDNLVAAKIIKTFEISKTTTAYRHNSG